MNQTGKRHKDGHRVPVSVTASIGATVLSHADSADLAIRRADELMYESKRSGGDRTTAG